MQRIQYTLKHKEKQQSREDTKTMTSTLTTQSFSNQDRVVLAQG